MSGVCTECDNILVDEGPLCEECDGTFDDYQPPEFDWDGEDIYADVEVTYVRVG